MYDVIIIGAGSGGIFSAYELMKQDENLKIAVFDAGRSLEQRHCPIDGEKGKELYRLQDLCNHERIWRSRSLFGW